MSDEQYNSFEPLDSNEENLDKLFDFFLKVPVTISILLIVLIPLCLILSYIFLPNSREILNFVIITFTASAGITSVIYFLRNARLNRKYKKSYRTDEIKTKKIDRALELISRWDTLYPSYLQISTLEFLNNLEEAKNNQRLEIINKEFESSHGLRQTIISMLNFFEQLAIVVLNEDAEEKRLKAYYRNIILRYHDLFLTWITQLRQKKTGSIGEDANRYFKNLDDLVNRWK